MLYIVSTPIGNLADLSQRAQDVFCHCDLILAEDTRQSRKILKKLNISKRIVSCHEHSSERKIEQVLDEASRVDAVFCSDAGTPNLCDPGGKLVARAMQKGIKVEPIPGPSALTTLISVCPFPCNRFEFLGYFPKKKGRETLLGRLAQIKTPVFFFESPHRISKTLMLLKGRLKNKNIIIGRELTKKFAQITFSTVADLEIEKIPQRGEFIIGLF